MEDAGGGRLRYGLGADECELVARESRRRGGARAARSGARGERGVFPGVEFQLSGGDCMKPILTMSDIDKSFPGIQALEKVHLEVYPGEVHAIVGENGAGKSTLMKILAGLYLPDNGVIRIDDEPVTIPDQIESRRHGIAMVYQELNLVPDLSVAENIALGAM